MAEGAKSSSNVAGGGSSPSGPPAAQPWQDEFRRTEMLLEASRQITASIESKIQEIDNAWASFSGSSLILSVNLQVGVGALGFGYSVSGGMMASFDFSSGRFDRGGFLTSTPLSSTELLPALSAGGGASVGIGETSGFFGTSSVQSVGAGGFEIAAAENKNYLGLAVSIVPGLSLPTASWGEGSTIGEERVESDDIYSEWSDLKEYLWGDHP